MAVKQAIISDAARSAAGPDTPMTSKSDSCRFQKRYKREMISCRKWFTRQGKAEDQNGRRKEMGESGEENCSFWCYGSISRYLSALYSSNMTS